MRNTQGCCVRGNRPSSTVRRINKQNCLGQQDQRTASIGGTAQDPRVSKEEPNNEKRHGQKMRQSRPPVPMTKRRAERRAVATHVRNEEPTKSQHADRVNASAHARKEKGLNRRTRGGRAAFWRRHELSRTRARRRPILVPKDSAAPKIGYQSPKVIGHLPV